MNVTLSPLSSLSGTGERQVIDLLTDHGTTLFLAIVKGALFFGGVALVLAFVLFLAGMQRGWVDIRGRKSRLARIVLGIGLFLGFVPLIAGAGVAHYLGKATVTVVRAEIGQTASLQVVGGALLAPAVLANLVVHEDYDTAEATALSWSQLQDSDLSFLLSEATRKQALEGLTRELARAALDQIPGYREARDKQVLGYLVGVAEDMVLGKVGDSVASYSQLLSGIEADDGGQVTFERAARSAGMAFFTRTVQPLLRGPYHSVRLQLIILALLLVALLFGMIQLVGRWLIRDQADGGQNQPGETQPGETQPGQTQPGDKQPDDGE